MKNQIALLFLASGVLWAVISLQDYPSEEFIAEPAYDIVDAPPSVHHHIARLVDIVGDTIVLREQDTTLYQKALYYLKWREGYSDTVYVDRAGHRTIGWGTRVDFLDTIPSSRSGHQHMLRHKFTQAYERVQRLYPGYERHQYIALALLRYNVGNFGHNLHRALKEHDTQTAVEYWGKYVYVRNYEGPHPRLLKCRVFEIQMFMGRYN